jgi:hypothetical protein
VSIDAQPVVVVRAAKRDDARTAVEDLEAGKRAVGALGINAALIE